LIDVIFCFREARFQQPVLTAPAFTDQTQTTLSLDLQTRQAAC
jgi:hypothetical protein